jgi:hypothetical protein
MILTTAQADALHTAMLHCNDVGSTFRFTVHANGFLIVVEENTETWGVDVKLTDGTIIERYENQAAFAIDYGVFNSTQEKEPCRHTEATRVYIGHNAAGGFWQHCHIEDGRTYPAPVGPQYKTRAEIHADHEAYLTRGGWLRDDVARMANALATVPPAPLNDADREAIARLPLKTAHEFPYYVINRDTRYIVAGFDSATDANTFRSKLQERIYITIPASALD